MINKEHLASACNDNTAQVSLLLHPWYKISMAHIEWHFILVVIKTMKINILHIFTTDPIKEGEVRSAKLYQYKETIETCSVFFKLLSMSQKD